MIWIKLLISPHNSHKVLCLTQIDNVMGITGEHMNSLDLISTNFKLDNFVSTYLTLLNKTMTGNNYKELPLAVMPVLSLSNPGIANIYRELTTVSSFQKLGKASSVIAVHLQIKDGLLLSSL